MVGAYVRERFPLQLYVPLAAFVAVAASPRDGTWRTGVLDGAYALALLLQFRTWDDLADRERDAVRHPQRVLVRAPQVTPVIAFCGALAVLNLCVAVWRDGSGVAVAVLAAVDAAFGAWYLSRGTQSVAGDLLLLAKYPTILVIVAGGRAADAPLQIAIGAAAFYAAACVYEAWHDPHSGLARRFPTLTSRHAPIGDR